MAERKIKKSEIVKEVDTDKTDIKDIDIDTRLSIIENKIEMIEKRLNINFGKGFIRDNTKQVSLHEIKI